MLSRREFLKLSGVVAAAFAVAPHVLIEREHEFNPSWEYGNAIPVTDYSNEEMLKMAVDILRQDAAKYLPSGVVYEIRAKNDTASFGRDKGIAWYYGPSVEQNPLVQKKMLYDERSGCYKLGRYRADMSFIGS